MRFLFCVSLIAFTSVPVYAVPPSAYQLFKNGAVEDARTSYRQNLAAAQKSGDPRAQWQALMAIAWFEDETSEHRASIEHSNAALEIASTLEDPFLIGRSLCWLGWAYSSIGMYEMADAFYSNAREIGAPNGEVKHVHVWGLAQQELGALRVKAGRIREGAKLLQETYTYATQHGIDVGIAEGGAHLAELALLEGRFADAERYANAAVHAAERCDCSQYNLSRAKVVRLKVRVERARLEASETSELRSAAGKLLTECEKRRQLRCAAEVKLLLSGMEPSENFATRYELLSSAFQELSNAESDLRGAAETEVGKLFLEQRESQLAALYLRNGLQVSREMFRKVDEAYATGALAELDGINGHQRAQLEKLADAAQSAEQTGALPREVEHRRALVDLLGELGYVSLALEEQGKALDAVNRLIERSGGESTERRYFEALRLDLIARGITLELQLTRPPILPPEAPQGGD